MKKKFKRSVVNLSSMTVVNGFFAAVTIKVNSSTRFDGCAFHGCKFIRRGFDRAIMKNCYWE